MNLDFLKDRDKKYWFRSDARSEFSVSGPLNPGQVMEISKFKGDPPWVAEMRLKGFESFQKLGMPDFGPELGGLNFANMVYYSKPSKKFRSWEDIPQDIRGTFEKLGINKSETLALSGLELQYDSEIIFEKTRESIDELGVVYMSMDEAVKKHPSIVRKYMGKIVPDSDNKFAALNTAVWSGGTFIYVPKGVKVPFPLHTYFRINLEGFGQFERTLIVVDEGAEVTYVEGCTAPIYSRSILHAAVVEVVALPGARVKYITLQNWSKNVYNIVTKRAVAHEGAFVQWIDGNFGSGVTMKYPSVHLVGKGAKGEVVSIAVVTGDQEVDSGAGMVHLAPDTSSNMVSKTISMDSGVSTFRGFLRVSEEADASRASVLCDSLLLGDSVANAIPTFDVRSESCSVEHEAKMGNLDQEKLFYLMSRGIDEKTAMSMIVFGFMREFINELPMEYALELQRLIEIDMEGQQ